MSDRADSIDYKARYEQAGKYWDGVYKIVLDERDALRAATAARPIATAPKDTAIIVYNHAYTIAHFNTLLNRWIGRDRDTTDTISLAQFPPTHWWPLPPPPQPQPSVTPHEGGGADTKDTQQ